MIWSRQQDGALIAVRNWLRDRDRQVFRLFGYAGTGKTTLAKHFAEGVDGPVRHAAFTGKAAHVMRNMGCEGASTIHHLIYRPIDESEDGALTFELKWASTAACAALIIIDECSMVDAQMGHDLLGFGKPVLVLGDPFQLPPIDSGGYFTNAKPDVLLTEVHRQARDNPIIAMATTVREGGRLARGAYGDSRVLTNAHNIDPLDADQVLVGRNATRRQINARVRARRELVGDYPLAGDKLVCLRNNYTFGTDTPLLNGSLWRVKGAYVCGDEIELSLQSEDDDGELSVTSHTYLFTGRERELSKEQRAHYGQFSFGYALTVHKAQGSQWRDVLLHNEAAVFGADARRWLYTGLTRAQERVTVIQRPPLRPLWPASALTMKQSGVS
jgi:exodeoxyribonuclease-5